ncbi:unnamed protein product [Prorocentrum cordatum]|uniref:Uncharacterized protein n=1 Tax=Prorocentrum cordatum TaxID=2364126 RepID=A0ABN9WZL8_9DINO|nr:unnamed protein product [Polarella glacialis]
MRCCVFRHPMTCLCSFLGRAPASSGGRCRGCCCRGPRPLTRRRSARFKYEGKMEMKSLSAKVAKFMPDHTIKLTKENVDTFLTTDPSKPKVVLFSNKKSVPLIWKALSSETVFKRTVKFGFATEADTDIVSKFKALGESSSCSAGRSPRSRTETYKGELKFLALKDRLGEPAFRVRHGRQGARPGGGIDRGGEALARAGGARADRQVAPGRLLQGGRPVRHLPQGDGEASQQEIDMLTGLSKKFTSQLSDRGAKMKWMWMNLAIEGTYKELFDQPVLPSAVVFNPHKRLRFAKMEHGEDNEIKGDEDSITKLLDKVLGGDARFKIVPGQKLPAWAQRGEAPPKKEGKKEL